MRVFILCLLLGNGLFVNAQTYFPPIIGSSWDTLSPQNFNWCQPKIDSLYAFLDSNDTKAFIVLIDGKIVLEKYFDTHTVNTPWYWASAGKTLTSFMTGMAQQEGFLSIQDNSNQYLGQGWTSCTQAQEAEIKIIHQLTMTSGLDDSGDPYCTLPSCLTYLADPETRWAYHNGPYTMLDGVIEGATGMTLNAYTTSRLKNPTGMTGSFIPVDYNNVFYSTARSMARFGLLMLNEGNWDGNQIMTDSQYFNDMINTSQSINESYGYLWWLNGKASYHLPSTQIEFPGSIMPNAPADMYAALGKNGQFINVIPSKNMVLIRMGNEPTSVPVPYQVNIQIWDYMNDLECFSGVNELKNSHLSAYPNPTENDLTMQSEKIMTEVRLSDLNGNLVHSELLNSKSSKLSMVDHQAGIYFCEVTFEDGMKEVIKISVR